MKFLHLSDLHLGKRLKEQSFIEDQKYILEQIIAVADNEKPDGVIIAGDIYDKTVPSAEAVALFDNFLTRLSEMKLKIYVISGNHDSAERIAFGASLMKHSGVHFSPVYNGCIERITEKDEYGKINIFLLPFVKPSQVREFFPDREITTYTEAVEAVLSNVDIDTSERNIIIAHQNVTGASKSGSEEIVIGGLDNVDSSVFDDFDYVALGHIHSAQNIGGEKIHYCGTPMKYSFSEAKHEKSVTIAEFYEKNRTEIRRIALTPIRDMRDIQGLFSEIYDNEEKSDDYIRIILDDNDEITDAVGKLRHLFPNILELCYSNRRRGDFELLEADDDEIRNSPAEIFKQFFTEQTGEEPDDEIMAIIDEIIEQIKEELN